VNVFVIGVVADPARAEAVERAILAAHQRTTPFADLDHDREVWRGDHLVGASFAIHADKVGIGSYTRVTPRTFDTFSGLPRLGPLAGQRPWGETLGALRDDDRLRPRELGGVWALARATQDVAEVRTSSTGSEPVLVARRPGLVLMGNRAALVRLAAWPEFPIAYDTDALSTMCARGWLAHDRVPFSGLELAPPGACIRASPDGVHIEVAQHLAEPGEAPATDGDVGEVYDTIAAELEDAAREVGRLGPRPRIEVTGDVVTRLSAAAYAAAGIEVTLVTPHAAGSSHAQVAADIAASMGAAHECAPVECDSKRLLEQTAMQVSQGEGTSNVFDPCGPVRLDPVVEVVRHAGGALLGGYDNLASGPRPAVVGVDEGRAFLDDLSLHNEKLLLRQEASTAQQQTNRRTAEELLDEVGRLSFHELAYLRLREGRGTGANRQAAAYGALQFAPMLDDRVLRHLGDIPLEAKRSHRAIFALVDRLAPELARIPLVGARWRFEKDGPDPSFDPETWARREPLPAQPGSAGGWRTRPDGSLWPVMVRRLDTADPLLDEIVDRRKLSAVLHADEPPHERDLRSLYGALTARHLLDGSWLTDGRPERPSRARRSDRSTTRSRPRSS
jgi:hypothetical protein